MASGNIDTYGVLAGNIIDLNYGISKITGDLGSFNAITGSGSAIVSGAQNIGASINDALIYADFIYSMCASYLPDTITVAADIGGMTFNIGINALTNSGVTISDTITLDGAGEYLFQIPNGDLITDPSTQSIYFNFINGAKASDVYWIINGNVNLQTIGNTTSFAGTILCTGNITMGTSSSSSGGLIAFSSSPSGIITLNQNAIVCRNSQIILDQISNDVVNIATTLSDSQAIQINAANPNGGILINAGFGGIEINTTNSISMNANAASNLSTTLGDVAIQSQPALVNIDAGVGVNIGCDNNMSRTSTPIITPIINIGTSVSSKTISVGNTTGATAVNLDSGTGGITLNSSTGQVNIVGNNSGTNAINLDASSGTNGVNIISGSGGVTSNSSTGKTQIVSNNTSVDAIRLDTSGSSGGVFIAAGSSGITIGNDGVDHPIVIGNTTGTSGATLQSGTGGTAINTSGGIVVSAGSSGISMNTSFGGAIGIGHWAGGEIFFGTAAASRVITIGNNTASTSLVERYGPTGGFIQNQFDEASLGTGLSISATDLLKRIITTNASSSNNLELPTLSDIINAITPLTGGMGVQVNDAIDFSIINLSNTSTVTLIKNSLDTLVTANFIGNNAVSSTNSTSFRLRIINLTTEYTLYRIG